MRPRPHPPRPDVLRTPRGRFGWLEDRFLHDRWLERLGLEGTAVLTLLALAADRHGASYYRRDRMAAALAVERAAVDRGLARLLALRLVLHRPWRAGDPDGVWQLLPLSEEDPCGTPRRDRPSDERARQPMSVAEALQQLGLTRRLGEGHPESRWTRAPSPDSRET